MSLDAVKMSELIGIIKKLLPLIDMGKLRGALDGAVGTEGKAVGCATEDCPLKKSHPSDSEPSSSKEVSTLFLAGNQDPKTRSSGAESDPWWVEWDAQKVGWYMPIEQAQSLVALSVGVTADWHAGKKGYPAYVDGKIHLGVDFRAKHGSDVFAIGDGEVTHINGKEPNRVMFVRHESKDGTFIAVYGHIKEKVVLGSKVEPDAKIAVIANSSQPHLHFGIASGETRPSGGWGRMDESSPDPDNNGLVDPLKYLGKNPPLQQCRMSD